MSHNPVLGFVLSSLIRKASVALLGILLFSACTFDMSVTDNDSGIGGNPGAGSGGSGGGSSTPALPQYCTDYDSYTGPTRIFRSVGPGNTVSLADGTSNGLTISNSVATFSQDLPLNIGVGDAIEYDLDNNGTNDTIAFIHCRNNSRQYIIKDVSGASVSNMPTSDQDWVIRRAYTSLFNAEEGTVNTGLTMPFDNDTDWTAGVGRNLVNAGEAWFIACYGDNTDTTRTTIDGWTTNGNSTLVVFTPNKINEVGVSQRHQGRWDTDKYHLVNSNQSTLTLEVPFTYILGLQVHTTSAMSNYATIDINANSSYIGHNIVRMNMNPALTINPRGILASSLNNVVIWNNIVYGVKGGVGNAYGRGMELFYGSNNFIYNNTVYGSGTWGFGGASQGFTAINNISYNNGINYYGNYTASSKYNLSGPVQTDAPGSSAVNGATVAFANASQGDFHLTALDVSAKGAGLDLSSDPNMAFIFDIDGQTRPIGVNTWDIGADQLGSILPSNLSLGNHFGTQWDGVNSWIESDGATQVWQLPDNADANGWVDMTGNVLLMHLNEASGSFIDSSPNTNNGSEVGGVTYGQSGKMDLSPSGDGIDDYIAISDHSSLDFVDGEKATFSVWFKVLSYPLLEGGILSKYSSSVGESGILVRMVDINGDTVKNEVRVFVHGSANADGAGCGLNTGVIELNTWYHVVSVVDSSIDTCYLYFNGDSIGQTGNILGDFNNNSETLDFLRNNSGTPFLNGQVDEVSIWRRALSANEIRRMYDSQSPAFAGYYRSQIFDAGSVVSWDKLSWVPQRPAGKELPDNLASETLYAEGNADLSNLIGYWKLNEEYASDSTSILDSSSTKLHGTLTTADALNKSRSGRFNNALHFDGTDDQLVIPYNSAFDNVSNMTVSMWAKLDQDADQVGTDITLYKKNDGSGGTGIALITRPPGGLVTFWAKDSTSTLAQGESITQLKANQWYHLTLVYSVGQPLGFYLNGQDDTNWSNTPVNPMLNATQSLVFGAHQGTEYFVGNMDEIAIWDRALSPTEISDLYKRGSMRLRYQVRSCASACANEAFIGPDGTSSTYYSELENPVSILPNLQLFNVPKNQYFQYRAYEDTFNNSLTPELKSVNLEVSP